MKGARFASARRDSFKALLLLVKCEVTPERDLAWSYDNSAARERLGTVIGMLSPMADVQQRTVLIAEDDDGRDYVYLETDVPFDGENYHEWIVEELPEQRYRLWRINGFPASGIVDYRRREECSAAELRSAGFADAPRVRRVSEH